MSGSWHQYCLNWLSNDGGITTNLSLLPLPNRILNVRRSPNILHFQIQKLTNAKPTTIEYR